MPSEMRLTRATIRIQAGGESSGHHGGSEKGHLIQRGEKIRKGFFFFN